MLSSKGCDTKAKMQSCLKEQPLPAVTAARTEKENTLLMELLYK